MFVGFSVTSERSYRIDVLMFSSVFDERAISAQATCTSPPITRDKWLWLGIFGISVEDYDCRLLRPTYRTHDGSPPSADMFGITSQKIWSKMTSSYTSVNVLNTATETAEKALFSPVPGENFELRKPLLNQKLMRVWGIAQPI